MEEEEVTIEVDSTLEQELDLQLETEDGDEEPMELLFASGEDDNYALSILDENFDWNAANNQNRDVQAKAKDDKSASEVCNADNEGDGQVEEVEDAAGEEESAARRPKSEQPAIPIMSENQPFFWRVVQQVLKEAPDGALTMEGIHKSIREQIPAFKYDKC